MSSLIGGTTGEGTPCWTGGSKAKNTGRLWCFSIRYIIGFFLHAKWSFSDAIASTFKIQGSHGDWTTWKMKVVMEKSWNMTNWPKVMEFCYQSWNLPILSPRIVLDLYVFLSSLRNLASMQKAEMPTFSAKCRKCKIDKRDGHVKLRHGHRKVTEKYSFKSVGTLR